MGLFLQKTNIIRDYLEDILEEPAPRMFWPREIWGSHAQELAEFKVGTFVFTEKGGIGKNWRRACCLGGRSGSAMHKRSPGSRWGTWTPCSALPWCEPKVDSFACSVWGKHAQQLTECKVGSL